MRRCAIRCIVAALVLAVFVAGLTSGCAVAPPGRPADFPAMTVLRASPHADGLGSILVESQASGQASVNVTKNTRVLVRTASGYERGSFADLRPGQTLDIWTTGIVAESYPVQAWATAILVKDE